MFSEGYRMGWNYTYAKGIPIEAQYLYKKAMDLYNLGETETALKYLRQTTVIAPRYSKALFEMGNCLAKLGQQEEASARYEQAIQIDPALKETLEKRI
jgi:tetratricopeptide (TPR) repeat protein